MATPSALAWLLARLTRLVQAATDALEASYPNGVADWQQEIARQLARYHAASMLAGAGVDTLSKPQTAAVTSDLATHLHFLDRFGVVVRDGKQWDRGWNARAEMYAQSIKTPYWRGRTKMLPLPAMPADGTSQCLTNCLCSWDIEELDGDNNYDCYWRLSAAESCATCIQRGKDWSPLQVRGGVVQL